MRLREQILAGILISSIGLNIFFALLLMGYRNDLIELNKSLTQTKINNYE